MHLEVPYLDTHREVAAALYRQRKLWMTQEYVGAHSLASLEHRQRVHIHVLSHTVDQEEEIPAKEHDVFVYLVARMQSKDKDIRNHAYRKAMECLLSEVNQQNAATQALLFYPQQDNSDLIKLFHENEEVQPILFDLWCKQSVHIDIAIINAAANSSRPELASAALRYAAENTDLGRDLFNQQLENLTDTYSRSSLDVNLLAPALWGNMLRSDPDIYRKIRLAIEKTPTDNNKPLVRLAALSGNQDLFPIIDAWASSHPDPGLSYLALTGRKEAAGILFEHLEESRYSDIAARAWTWLTGQVLPMIPIMQVVGEEESKTKDATADIPLQPDASQAVNWLRKNKEQWNLNDRKIAGKDFSLSYLLERASEISGIAGQNYRDLLALMLGKPLGTSKHAWIMNQEIVYKRVAEEINPQPVIDEKRRHA